MFIKSDLEIIDSLTKHQLILLLTVAKQLQKSAKTEIGTPELKEAYKELCSIIDERPRRDSTISEYLKSLGERGIINRTGEIGKVKVIRLLAPIDDVLTKTTEQLKEFIDKDWLEDI